MRKLFLVFSLLLVSILGIASKLDKGFEALSMFNYFEAKKIFEKSFKKQPVAASYGLCKVYDAEKSPFFNIDTAFKFILLCDANFNISNEKQRIKLQEFNIDSVSIFKERIYLATFFFERATSLNTLEAYQEFIEKHKLAKEFEEAVMLRNHAAYLQANKKNNIETWGSYLVTYPNSNDYLSAKKQLQILEYKEMTAKGDAESFRRFVEKYPENPYSHDAQEMVYQIYTQDKKLNSYVKFIKENPRNRNVSKAWSLIYRISISEYNIGQLYEFMIDFPDFPNQELLKQDIHLARTEFFPLQKDGLWGFVDTAGTWMIKAQYNWAISFKEGKAVVGFVEKSVFINKHGSLIFNHLFDDAESFENGLAVVELEGEYGVINHLGDTIIPILYDELGAFSNNLIYAGVGDKYGYYNAKGELKIPFQYTNAFDFIENLAVVQSNDGYGVINDSGRVVVPLIFESVLLDLQFCIVKDENKFGVLTYNGDTLVPFIYDRIGTFKDNRAIAVTGKTFQYLNRNGNIAINEEFEFNALSLSYSAFENGYARVIVKEKVGIIDTTGARVYPAIFTDVGLYGQELTAINKGDGWGYANQKVKLVIPYTYKYASDFELGFAIVENDSLQGVINSNNELIIPFSYNQISRVESNLLQVEANGKMGILNYQGDIIVQVMYEKIEWLTPDVVRLKLDNSMLLFSISTSKFLYKEEIE